MKYSSSSLNSGSDECFSSSLLFFLVLSFYRYPSSLCFFLFLFLFSSLFRSMKAMSALVRPCSCFFYLKKFLGSFVPSSLCFFLFFFFISFLALSFFFFSCPFRSCDVAECSLCSINCEIQFQKQQKQQRGNRRLVWIFGNMVD